jgi:ring-1,2-phenylacetyl-CoA epoxidase subunit PaaD
VPLPQGEAAVAAAWRALGGVADPEVPVVSIVELGIVREVVWRDDTLVVVLTPTYSGCPATDVIEAEAHGALTEAGVADHRIEYRLAPPWTTDWLAPEARERLRRFGIAPPGGSARVDVTGISPLRRAREKVACPRCGSVETQLIAQFGSTACKAQYRCNACLEPFDYFKPH